MDAFLRFCGRQLEFSRVFKFDLIATSAYATATVYIYGVSATQTVATLAQIGFFCGHPVVTNRKDHARALA